MLVGILLLSFNLRPAAVSIGPVLAEVRAAFGMSPATAGLLTSLPVLAFAIFGALAPAAAAPVRHPPGHPAGARWPWSSASPGGRSPTARRSSCCSPCSRWPGMAMANVLLPSLVKLHFPDRIGLVTALYTTALSIGLTAALVLTVPISDALGGWRYGLGAWAALGRGRRGARGSSWPPTTATSSGPPRTVTFRDVARTRLGLAMALFFGLQSLQAYAIFGWFAQLWRDSGYSRRPSPACWPGVLAGTAIPLSLWLPNVLARSADPRRVLFAVIACYPVGYVGLMVAPHGLALLWAVVVGIGDRRRSR